MCGEPLPREIPEPRYVSEDLRVGLVDWLPVIATSALVFGVLCSGWIQEWKNQKESEVKAEQVLRGYSR